MANKEPKKPKCPVCGAEGIDKFVVGGAGVSQNEGNQLDYFRVLLINCAECGHIIGVVSH